MYIERKEEIDVSFMDTIITLSIITVLTFLLALFLGSMDIYFKALLICTSKIFAVMSIVAVVLHIAFTCKEKALSKQYMLSKDYVYHLRFDSEEAYREVLNKYYTPYLRNPFVEDVKYVVTDWNDKERIIIIHTTPDIIKEIEGIANK